MRLIVLLALGCVGLTLGFLFYGLLRGQTTYGFPLEQMLELSEPVFETNLYGVLPQWMSNSLPSFLWQLSLSSFYYAAFCTNDNKSSVKDIVAPLVFGVCEEASQYFREGLSFDTGDVLAICLAAFVLYVVAFIVFKPKQAPQFSS